MDKNQSLSIDLLRFPLAVFVVFIHTTPTLSLVPLNEADFPILSGMGIYNVIEILLKEVLPHIAVPTFFVISGFLFFQKLNVWKWDIYRQKLLSRIRTLLIPYICWITISYLCIAGIPTIESLLSGSTLHEAWRIFNENRYSLINCYIGIECIKQFPDWLGNDIIQSGLFTVPILWFLRDLIAVSLLSPLFYFFLKKTNIFGLILLGVYYMSNHAFEITSVFFYSIGAYLSINNKSITIIAKKIRRPTLFVAIISLIACTYFAGRLSFYGFRIYPFYVLSGVWAAFYISTYLVEKKHIVPNRFLVHSCFFIYAFHYLKFSKDWYSSCISYSYEIIAKLFNGTPHVELLQFLTPPVLTILVCLGLFWIMQKFTPRLCRLLTGNRC